MRRSPSLPPLESLRAFRETALLGGFRRAGEALSISQSAVSHHIRKLEEMLGKPLFVRHAKSISLTAEGQLLLAAVQEAFGALEDASARIRGGDPERPLRVSLLPSFAANWLMARIGRFRAAHPGLEIQFDPTLDLADPGRGGIDLAIRYGARPEAAEVRLLFAEELCPAAAPDYAAGPPVRSPRDLLAHPLLDSRGSREWRLWLEAHGLDPAEARFVQLKDYNVVIEAMASGQGIAIARMRLLAGQIAAGRLRPCFATRLETLEAAHWVLLPEGPARHPAAGLFADWLAAEAQDSAG